MKKIALTLFFVAIIIGGLIYLRVFRSSPSDVGNKRTDIEINSHELVSQFNLNEDSANARFLNKVLLVKGTVSELNKKDGTATIYLKNEEDLAGVMCSFAPESSDLKNIQEGDEVKVKGVCTGFLLDVVLNKCSIDNSH